MDIKQEIESLLGVEEMKNWRILFKQLFAEFLGTFLYLAIALLASTDVYPNAGDNTVQIALANGLFIATVVQIIGHVSGGHVNPAVTLGVMVYGQIKVLRAVCYVAAQVFGAIAGSYVSYALITKTLAGDLGATEPYEHLGPAQVLALEFLMTLTLVLVVLSAIDPHRGGKGLGSTPLAIGFCITACQCACLLYSGSLNPVRSLGPAVVMNRWKYHWVYWVGPLLGGGVAGAAYRFVLGANYCDVIVAE